MRPERVGDVVRALHALLVYALREQFTKVRAFGFVDELDEISRFFTPGGDVLDAVTRLANEADVTWLLGRTDYGRALELFAARFPDAISLSDVAADPR